MDADLPNYVIYIGMVGFYAFGVGTDYLLRLIEEVHGKDPVG